MSSDTKTLESDAGELVRRFAGQVVSYRDALHHTMRDALQRHPHTIIIGQGVDDHKGIFGSTSGLAKEFGADRVMDTPLAEEATTGIILGAALNGLYPIQTHIRADFVLLAMNQILNLAAKYKYMFGGLFEVPMLIRMVIGRSWGQGAQHSQSLQSLFAHIPGLTVIMPASSQTILESYPFIIGKCRGPVVSIEHRLMYDLKFHVDGSAQSAASPLTSHRVRPGKDVTIVAASIMVLEAVRAAEHLAAKAGIDCEVIDSVRRTGKLLVADTSWKPYGVCAEVCRMICEKAPSALKAPVVTMGMEPAPCPTAKSLEDLYYPNLQTLSDAIAKLVTGKEQHGIALPDEHSMADVYKRFKGPF
jgi:acetoin:2,6-dichlorophenolindophenol oxidoreductase subunit beta